MSTNRRLIALVATVSVVILILAAALVSLTYTRAPTSPEQRPGAGLEPLTATLKPGEANAILTPGIEAIERTIRLRDEFLKRGFDFKNATNIPELKEELPYLAAYYRNAASAPEFLERKNNLEKVLKQMEDVFAKKGMTLNKWIWFHLQLSELFSDYDHLEPGLSGLRNENLSKFGNLDFKELESDADIDPTPFLPRSTSFPCFVYIHDGVLGLQTLNLALVSDILVLGAPTDKSVKADGRVFNPFIFMLHDAQHFAQYSRSAYVFTRFRSSLMNLYRQIESQSDAVERIHDHLALFMFTHEMLPRSNGYPESLERLLQESAAVSSRALLNEVPEEVYQDFDGIFRLILNPRDYRDSDVASNMKVVSDRFLAKYAPLRVAVPAPTRRQPVNDATLEAILQAGRPQVDQAIAIRAKLEAAKVDIWRTPVPELAERFPALVDFYRRVIADKPKKEIARLEKLLSDIGRRMAKQPLDARHWISIHSYLVRAVDNPENANYRNFPSSFDSNYFQKEDLVGRDFPCFVYGPAEALGIPAKIYAHGNDIFSRALSPFPNSSDSMVGAYFFGYDDQNSQNEKVLSLFKQIEGEKNLRSRALDHLVFYLALKLGLDDFSDVFHNDRFRIFEDTVRAPLSSLSTRSRGKTEVIYDLLGRGDIQIEQITASTFLAINLQDPARPKVSTFTVLDETPFNLTLKIAEGGSTKEQTIPRFLKNSNEFGQVVDDKAALLFEALGYDVASPDFADTVFRLFDSFGAKYKLKGNP